MAKSSVSLQEGNGKIIRISETAATKAAADNQLALRVAFTVGAIVPGSYSSSSGENPPTLTPATGAYSDATVEGRYTATQKPYTANLENVSNALGDGVTGDFTTPVDERITAWLTAKGVTYKDGKFRR